MESRQLRSAGPTGFVESIARTLTGLGLSPGQVRTERFGPSGGGA